MLRMFSNIVLFLLIDLLQLILQFGKTCLFGSRCIWLAIELLYLFLKFSCIFLYESEIASLRSASLVLLELLLPLGFTESIGRVQIFALRHESRTSVRRK